MLNKKESHFFLGRNKNIVRQVACESDYENYFLPQGLYIICTIFFNLHFLKNKLFYKIKRNPSVRLENGKTREKAHWPRCEARMCALASLL